MNARASWNGALVAIALTCFGGLRSAAADASEGGPYRLDPTVIANGGGSTDGGDYALDATLGQIATRTLVAAPYALHGGFWAAAPGTLVGDAIFANGFD
jgi:hypothetical protein